MLLDKPGIGTGDSLYKIQKIDMCVVACPVKNSPHDIKGHAIVQANLGNGCAFYLHRQYIMAGMGQQAGQLS